MNLTVVWTCLSTICSNSTDNARSTDMLVLLERVATEIEYIKDNVNENRICVLLGVCTEQDKKLREALTKIEHVVFRHHLHNLYDGYFAPSQRRSILNTGERVLGKDEILNVHFTTRFLIRTFVEPLTALQFLARHQLIHNQLKCPRGNCEEYMSLIREKTSFIVSERGAKQYDAIFSGDAMIAGKSKNISVHQLGGPGKIVEIDESLFYRRKYNRGRLVPEIWVFGLIERGSDDVYMEVVPKRDRSTLIPIVEKHVAPDTTVISDGWRAYFSLPSSQNKYTHKWVNHKVSFVDPFDDDVHTQSIEATWGGVKRTLKHLSGASKSLFPTYLYNYMFRRAHRNHNIFEHIIFWTSIFHNPNY